MKCSKCGFDNSENAKYCINCGSRMDGSIICPKCKEVIPANANACPMCGYKLPTKSEESNARNKKMSKVFTLVSNILLIFGFAISLFLVWGKYVYNYSLNYQNYGYAQYFLFSSWGVLIDNLKLTSDTFRRFGLYSETIIQFLIVLFNIVVTYIFGIKGIIDASYNLKNQNTKRNTFLNIAVILVSNIFAFTAMISTSYDFMSESASRFSTSDYLVRIIVFACFIFIASIVFNNIATFKKGEGSHLVEKILYALSFFFAIFTLLTNQLYVSSYTFRSTSLVFMLIDNYGQYGSNNSYVIAFVISLCLVFFKCMMAIALGVFIVYFGLCYFGKSETKRVYRVPAFALAILAMICSAINVILNSMMIYFLNNANIVHLVDLGSRYDVQVYNFSLGSYTWTNFIFMMITLSLAIVSFVLSKNYNQSQELLETND